MNINKHRKIILCTLLMTMVTFMAAATINAYGAEKNATGVIKPSSGAIMRSSYSTKSRAVKGLKKGTKITIIREAFRSKTSTAAKYKWYYVKAGSRKGYVRSDLVKTLKHSPVKAYVTTGVNCRKGAGTSMSTEGVLKKGTAVKVVLAARSRNSSATWYKIKRDTGYRYVYGKYVEFGNPPAEQPSEPPAVIPPAETKVTASSLRYPTLITKGRSYTISGSIKSTTDMSTIRVGVKDSSGKWVEYTDRCVNAASYSISDADKDVHFGKLDYGDYKYVCEVKAGDKKYTPVSKAFTVKRATGARKIANKAIEIAWPSGTKSSKFAYPSGSATAAFKEAIKTAYPDRSSWGAAPKVGASCDVFVGTVIRSSGYDKTMPRGLDGMWKTLPSSEKWKKIAFWGSTSELESGDVIIYSRPNSGHVFLYLVMDGKPCIAEAHYKKAFGYIDVSSYTVKTRIAIESNKKMHVYRATS